MDSNKPKRKKHWKIEIDHFARFEGKIERFGFMMRIAHKGYLSIDQNRLEME